MRRGSPTAGFARVTMTLAARSPPERSVRRCGRDTSSFELTAWLRHNRAFRPEALALSFLAEDVQRDPTPEAWTPRQVYSIVPRAAQLQVITYQAPSLRQLPHPLICRPASVITHTPSRPIPTWDKCVRTCRVVIDLPGLSRRSLLYIPRLVRAPPSIPAHTLSILRNLTI